LTICTPHLPAFIKGCVTKRPLRCPKSNNSSPSAKTSIVGKWSYSADTIKYFNNGTLDQTDTNGGVTSSDYFQFNSDGTGSQVLSGDATTFTYTYANGKVTLNAPAQTIAGMAELATKEVASVKSVTCTNLFLFLDDTEVNGSVTSEVTEAAHFKKQ